MSRSKWKGFFIQKKKNNQSNKKNIVQIINKNVTIVPKLTNKIFQVHSGKTYFKFTLTKEMIGHKVGEFVLTRAKYIFKQKKAQKNFKKSVKK